VIGHGVPVAFLVGFAVGFTVGFAVGWLLRGTEE
jgi:NhaP-type Na+/H+ or K+/H+ antiporter